jgi:hypothetical protein
MEYRHVKQISPAHLRRALIIGLVLTNELAFWTLLPASTGARVCPQRRNLQMTVTPPTPGQNVTHYL